MPLLHDSFDSINKFDVFIVSRGSASGSNVFADDARGARKSIFVIAFQDEATEGYRVNGAWNEDLDLWKDTVTNFGSDEYNIMHGGIYHVRHTLGTDEVTGERALPKTISLKLGSLTLEPTSSDIASLYVQLTLTSGIAQADEVHFAVDSSGSMTESDVQPGLNQRIATLNSVTNTTANKDLFLLERWVRILSFDVDSRKATS